MSSILRPTIRADGHDGVTPDAVNRVWRRLKACPPVAGIAPTESWLWSDNESFSRHKRS